MDGFSETDGPPNCACEWEGVFSGCRTAASTKMLATCVAWYSFGNCASLKVATSTATELEFYLKLVLKRGASREDLVRHDRQFMIRQQLDQLPAPLSFVR